MQTYHPKISVKLIKAVNRGELSSGREAAGWRYGSLVASDITSFLGDGAVVTVSKSVREPMGTFNINLSDVRDLVRVETLMALVEPMDLIEIRMARSPEEYGGELPIVMRGFVGSVTRTETIVGGQPRRSVTIAGNDFGKIMQILQIYYLNLSGIGDDVLTEFAFFHKYSTAGQAKIKPANDMAREIVEGVIGPYLKRIAALTDGSSVGAKAIDSWSVEASIKGAVDPWVVASFNNVSVYQMMAQMFDVGPFNEMFVEDREDGVVFVLRPNPFLNIAGKSIQGTPLEWVEVTDQDIQSMSLARTDAGVANYFWVQSSKLPFMQNEGAQLVANIGDTSTFVMFDYINARASLYGLRKMEVTTNLLDPNYGNVEAQQQGDLEAGSAALTSWLDDRRLVLSESNKDNVIFESGTIEVKGNEKLKAGRQLVVVRANGMPFTAYITKVDHTFVPLQGFTTRLAVERATSFVERASAEEGQYLLEVDGKGVR